jgi:peptidoglycan pentaglycine glycine transferase (the first glycine)
VMKRLRDLGKKRKAIGIRLEPNLPAGRQVLGNVGLVRGRKLFKDKTYWWNLTKSEEELLKAMHPKGRYNIKVAQKHGVTVKQSDDIDKYLELMFEGTAKRQGIYSHSRNYHRQLWSVLRQGFGGLSMTAHLWVAEYEGKILAADIIFEFKDKIYYSYGASALEHKEVMAPTLLLWEIARYYKKQNIKIFDLWGAEEGKGFSRFKSQFGADLIEMTGTFDLPINMPLYWVFRVAEEIRWRILRILK